MQIYHIPMFLFILNDPLRKKYWKVESHHTYLCPRAVKKESVQLINSQETKRMTHTHQEEVCNKEGHDFEAPTTFFL